MLSHRFNHFVIIVLQIVWFRTMELYILKSFQSDCGKMLTFNTLGTDQLTLKGGVWFFVLFRKIISDNTRVRIFIFFVAQSAIFFFQYLTLGYMTKILNQIFFFLHQNQNIYFSNIGNQNIFLEKNHNPPFKLNGRSLTCLFYKNTIRFLLWKYRLYTSIAWGV